jgi:hypothetical protein
VLSAPARGRYNINKIMGKINPPLKYFFIPIHLPAKFDGIYQPDREQN